MRLRTALQIIQTNLPKLKYAAVQINIPVSGVFFKAPGKRALLEALLELNKVKGLVEILSPILNHPVFSTPNDDITLPAQDYPGFNNAFQNAKTLIHGFEVMLQQSLPAQNPLSLSIKLPLITEFSEFEKFVKELRKAINPLVLEAQIGGKFEIQNLDSGSLWLEVLTEPAKATSLILGVIWAAVEVAKKMKEYELISQKVRGLEIKNDLLEEIAKATKKQLDQITSAEAANLQNTHMQSQNPELTTKFIHSIEILSTLILKGTEIHPALNAPEEIVKALPNFNDPDKLLSEPQRLLIKETTDT